MRDITGPETAIDDILLTRDERYQTVFVRLPRPAITRQQSEKGRVDTMRDNARRTQQSVVDFARNREGVSLRNRFWLANAVALEVDTDAVSLREIAALPGVRWIHDVVRFKPLDAAQDDESKPTEHGEHTYGLEQINVPEVWDEFDVTGSGVKVAVLDTGIDADHETLDLFTEDPSDPTYPGGWGEWDSDGNWIEGSEPEDDDDDNSHGTHVSGTVAGGDESPRGHIGVAPHIDLMHGGVLTDESQGSLLAIISALEWAVENDADVVNMSLGPEGGGYFDSIIEPLQNTQAAGVLPVSAVGNDFEGTSGSPANVYGAGIAVGASDANENIASFSSGELVTEDDWEDPPEEWPDEYVVPDVAAPGNNVYSAQQNDSYGEVPGTSMATPHVAGVAALMVSADPDLDPEDIWDILEETAWKPDDWDEGDAESSIDGKDSRYGEGIVDAYEAVSLVALDSGIEGTVTDHTDSPIEGVVVELGDEESTTTEGSGEYEFVLHAGEYTVTVDEFGFEAESHEVTVEEDEMAERDFSLDPELDLRVVDAQPGAVGLGDALETTVEEAHGDEIQVSQLGDYSTSLLDLTIDGDAADFDQFVALEDGITEVDIAVETDDDTSGDVELEVTVEGLGDSTTEPTGVTTVQQLRPVAVIDEDGDEGGLVGTLEDVLEDVYTPEYVSTSDVVGSPEDWDVVVAQLLDDDLVEDFVDTTTDNHLGVVYLDQWGSDADAIPQVEGELDAIEATGETWDGDSPYFNVTAEHPIVDEFDTDEDILIHTGDDSDHTWFDFADEQDAFDELATVEVSSAIAGSGLAIDEANLQVLAATLGRSEYVAEDDVTEEANNVLANVVEYLYDPTDVVELEEIQLAVGEGGESVEIDDGETVSYEVTAHYSDDSEEDITSDATVTSDDDSVVSVQDEANTVTGEEPGATAVEAEYDEVTDDVAVTVEEVLEEISLTIEDEAEVVDIDDGQTVPYEVTAHYSDDSTEEVTSNATVTSDDDSVVSVQDEANTVTGEVPGATSVQAAYDEETDDVSVTVEEVLEEISLTIDDEAEEVDVDDGETVPYEVTAVYSDDSEEDVTADATVTSNDDTVVSVQDGESTVTGESPGTTPVEAAYDEETDEVSVTVDTVLEEIVLAVNEETESATIQNEETALYEVTARNTDDSEADVTDESTVTSDDETVVSVQDEDSTVTGESPGSTAVEAEYAEETDEVSVTVEDAHIGELSFETQTPEEGIVIVADVTTGQDSTVLVTYSGDDGPVVAGLADADRITEEDVPVQLSHWGDLPGEYSAHVVADDAFADPLEPGDDASAAVDDALDSETTELELGDLSLEFDIEDVPIGTDPVIHLEVAFATTVEVQNVWIDWDLAATGLPQGSFSTAELEQTGTVSIDWGSNPTGWATPTIDVTLPAKDDGSPVYVGGTFELTAVATDGDGNETTTVTETFTIQD